MFVFFRGIYRSWFGEALHTSVPPQHHQTPNSKQAFKSGFSWKFPKEIVAEDYTPPPKKKGKNNWGTWVRIHPFVWTGNFSKARCSAHHFRTTFDSWKSSNRPWGAPPHIVSLAAPALDSRQPGSPSRSKGNPKIPGVCEVHVPLGSHHVYKQVDYHYVKPLHKSQSLKNAPQGNWIINYQSSR